ncbi:MAG: sugar phosphate isomerase/epimerase [Clostridia bacterium]|nr:sugar phosphate isomerase/epimerase [Clostridia bacterium]
MKFGMPTLVECKDIYECCEVAKRCGIDFVEINMSFPQYSADRVNIAELSRLMREYGIFYTIHADEQLNPFDFNPKVSECYFDVMRDTIRVARALDIPVINLHLQRGVYVTLPGRVILLSDVYFDEYCTRVKKFIEMCEEEIGDSGILIAIENVDTNPFTESQLRVMPLFLASPVFALTLDTGHEACLGFKDSHVFAANPERLRHLHLHDVVGAKPHMPLGTGEVDISAKLSALAGETCLIEVKTVDGLVQSVEYLKKNGVMKQ